MITVDALHQFDMKEDFHDDNDIINEATGEDWRSYLFFVHHISNPFVRFEEVLRLLAISTTLVKFLEVDHHHLTCLAEYYWTHCLYIEMCLDAIF